MTDVKSFLSKGIEILCKSDPDIDLLITPNMENIIKTLCRYINEIESFNPAYGLVGAKNTEELIIKHILDSLAPLGIISRALLPLRVLRASVSPCEALPPQIADAGSGAGLPGIPLAITLPEYNFTLIERMGRRAGFLLNTKAALELSNINIEESELEKVTAQFDLITFRAFSPIEPKLLKTLQKLLKNGGIIAAYKGKREKIEAEMASLKGALPDWEAIPYTVPFLEEERNLLVIR